MTREGGSGLCADAGEPDGVQRMLRGEVPSGMEGGAARWPIADDSCQVDLEAAKLVAADIDQAGVLSGYRLQISVHGGGSVWLSGICSAAHMRRSFRGRWRVTFLDGEDPMLPRGRRGP